MGQKLSVKYNVVLFQCFSTFLGKIMRNDPLNKLLLSQDYFSLIEFMYIIKLSPKILIYTLYIYSNYISRGRDLMAALV